MDVWWRSSNLKIIPGSSVASFIRNSNLAQWIVILFLRASSKRPCKIGELLVKFHVSKSRAPDRRDLSGLSTHEHQARKNWKYRDRCRVSSCGHCRSLCDRKPGVGPKACFVA